MMQRPPVSPECMRQRTSVSSDNEDMTFNQFGGTRVFGWVIELARDRWKASDSGPTE
jgi:hypothetical protein